MITHLNRDKPLRLFMIQHQTEDYYARRRYEEAKRLVSGYENK